MKFASIRLTNYIGIYNGMGLDEIYIDFRKSKHEIIIIKGMNGSGKSTLMGALHPLPDRNEDFIPKRPAKKEIELISDNILYKIKFIHGLKSNGEDRETTKAYISKEINGVSVELNMNGNVGSFKDVLYSEFNLDPSFVQLSQLSSEDRGIVDKTPAERKKFMNSVINTLQVYNNIHKTLTKRSSVFNSIVQRLISKMDSIGNETNVNIALASIEKRINNMMNERNKVLEDLTSYKSTVKLIDPDGSIQDTYNFIYNSIVEINGNIEITDTKLNKYYLLVNIPEEHRNIDKISKQYIELKDNINEINNSIFILENEIQYLLSERENEASSIKKKTAKLENLNNDKNFNDIKEMIKINKDKLKEYTNILNTIGISSNVNLSKDEYIIGLNTLKEIKDTIDVMKSGTEYSILATTIGDYIKTNNIPNLDNINNEIHGTQYRLKELEMELQHFNTLLNITKTLELRPKNCNIDSCEFIKDALNAFNQNPAKKIDNINQDIVINNNKLSKLELKRDEIKLINDCYIYLSRILRSIQNQYSILAKLPNTENILNTDILLDKIINGYEFNEINTLYSYIEYCDIFDDYKRVIDNLLVLENEYKIYESRNEMTEEIINEINALTNKLNDITTKIDTNRNSIYKYKEELEELKNIHDNYGIIIDLITNKNNLESEKTNLFSQFYGIKTNIDKIKDCKTNIINLTNKLDELDKNISPLIEDRDELKHNLKLLKEYQEELIEYKAKYEKIQEIKNYSSPTTGIQLLFIELYMNKTLSLANELLSYMFDGQFVIQPYIVNESEFRIPCIGDGLPRDDISSLSVSQKSMISMVLSFVFLHQSSTKYNILKLDEIDAALDETNRIQFVYLLRQKMNLLNVEQCIMVSHNNEINLANCDVILLKTLPGQIYDGNIIFRYNI